MRGSGSSPFGALLLAAPLIAVPMLAIFGIPQFAPGVDASSPVDASESEFGFEDARESTPRSRNPRRSADDLFSPAGGRESVELTESDVFGESTGRNRRDERKEKGEREWEPPEEALKGFRMAPPEEQFTDASSSEEWFEASTRQEKGERDEFDRDESRRDQRVRDTEKEDVDYDRPRSGKRKPREPEEVGFPEEIPTNEGGVEQASFEETDELPQRRNTAGGDADAFAREEFSWQKASRRLRELGDNVKHYFHYDIEKETFVFHCELSPLDDPGVRQDFEAEGQEPLITVYDVITQIEKWSEHRGSSLAKSEKKSSTKRSRSQFE